MTRTLCTDIQGLFLPLFWGCHRLVINQSSVGLSVASPRSFLAVGFPLPSRSLSATEQSYNTAKQNLEFIPKRNTEVIRYKIAFAKNRNNGSPKSKTTIGWL